MKNILTIILTTIVTASLQSQVAIGKESVTNSTVSLEFGTGNKGLLLPWVSTVPGTPNATYTGLGNPVDGTLIFDISDKKVKYRKAGDWFDLSIDNSGVVDTSLQDSLDEKTSAKAAIGANSTSDNTSGILVLTDTNKAMILPKVSEPHKNIINPPAGMLVYDTTNKMLAVFNGNVWTFWKP